MPQVAQVVNGHAAHIKANMPGLERLKRSHLPLKAVVNPKSHDDVIESAGAKPALEQCPKIDSVYPPRLSTGGFVQRFYSPSGMQFSFRIVTSLALVWALALALPALNAHAQSAQSEPLSATATIQQWIARDAPQEAMKVIEQRLRQNPNDPNLRFQKAYVLELLGQTDLAIAHYEALTEMHPEFSEPQNNLGVLMAAKLQLEQAQARFELALRANPHNLMARENLADVMIRLAQRHYQSVHQAQPNNPRIQTKQEALAPVLQLLKAQP
jgi:tetratricopeptide (TPR) repeat protein